MELLRIILAPRERTRAAAGGTIVESMDHGALDFKREFENGTLYNIDGIHHDSHEALNYYWGAALGKLNYSIHETLIGAMSSHAGAYFLKSKYKDLGIREENSHQKAQVSGYFNFCSPNRGTSSGSYLFYNDYNFSKYNISHQTRPIGK